MRRIALLILSLLAFLARSAAAQTGASPALERLKWRDDDAQAHEVAGKILTEADDGGLLLIGQDGRLWTIDKPQLVSRDDAREPFRPLPHAALAKQLQAELGREFDTVVTKHYVICTSARRGYAQWCGALFERLYLSFHNYWKQRGMKLVEPEFPLVALVFATEKEFAAFATKDAGADVASAKGYYSIGTNRMVLYDLTSSDATPIGDASDINRQVSAVPYNIATVIHEATHQIAFNSGMHTRYADNPLWLVEGMAMYFETPDLSSKTGWKTAGAVNDERLGQFRNFLSAGRRKPDSLKTLLSSDARFNEAEAAADAYAEAWALSFYLIRSKKEAYVKYLNALSSKPRLVIDTPEERLAEFRAAFGDDLQQLETDMLKAMRRLK
ncbi:MAG: DUF1570 domain-containing protein [Planctomycetia bacterium]|nr:DUF1570 domain-containing protein [Planctomycetia bacterium]